MKKKENEEKRKLKRKWTKNEILSIKRKWIEDKSKINLTLSKLGISCKQIEISTKLRVNWKGTEILQIQMNGNSKISCEWNERIKLKL